MIDRVVVLSDVEAGFGGLVINGVAANDWSGFCVSGAGDVNGDGFADLIVGAYGDDPNGGDSGANDGLYGWTGNDKLWGNAGKDTLLGQDGADTLDGGWGDDILTGGADADVFVMIR
jgi:Ca2+-binding RTX toxin-like protein